MIKITITRAEYVWAVYAGILRQHQNTLGKNTRKDAHGLDGSHGYDSHTLGAVGEFVASLAFGVPWRGPGKFRGDDIPGFQVRASRRSNGDLILHKTDGDDDRFVLVTGQTLQWKVVGWIKGRDGKQERFWNDPVGGRPAYFVPQSELRPIEELIEPAKAALEVTQ